MSKRKVITSKIHRESGGSGGLFHLEIEFIVQAMYEVQFVVVKKKSMVKTQVPCTLIAMLQIL